MPKIVSDLRVRLGLVTKWPAHSLSSLTLPVIKTEKLNDRQISYPPWHYRSLNTEKLNDRHISYPPWNSRLWPLHSSVILKMPVIKLKTKKLNHLHIFYPPWNSRSLKAEKLNERYITQQSSFLKLSSYPWTCIWIFSNYSGNSVIMTKIINLWN